MHMLIWVFADTTGLIVGFVVRWLKFDSIFRKKKSVENSPGINF